jgi:simple sugar transport system permease protein
MRLHMGFLIGVVFCLVLHVLMARTVLGLKIRAVGDNLSAARYAGIGVTRTMVAVGLLSGALAGLPGLGSGWPERLPHRRSLPRLRLRGIVVAMIAGLSRFSCSRRRVVAACSSGPTP